MAQRFLGTGFVLSRELCEGRRQGAYIASGRRGKWQSGQRTWVRWPGGS
jgi:hypothetical protein